MNLTARLHPIPTTCFPGCRGSSWKASDVRSGALREAHVFAGGNRSPSCRGRISGPGTRSRRHMFSPTPPTPSGFWTGFVC